MVGRATLTTRGRHTAENSPGQHDHRQPSPRGAGGVLSGFHVFKADGRTAYEVHGCSSTIFRRNFSE